MRTGWFEGHAMHMEQISFRYLMTLSVLHETQSMSKTANVLRRTQPAISLQIKSLERIVGFGIVEHVRGRFAFTRQGTRLAMQAKHLVASMDQMVRDVASSSDEIIRVGVTEDFYRRGMKYISEALDGDWIDVHIGPSGMLLDSFMDGKLDIAIVKSVDPLEDATKAWRHQPVWAGHPCESKGDRGIELVLLSESCLYHQLARQTLEKSARAYSVRSVCSSWDVIFHSLHRGGMTVVAGEWPGEAPLADEDYGLPRLPSATINMLVQNLRPKRQRDACEELVARMTEYMSFPDSKRLI